MVKVGDAEFSKELSIVTVCRKCTFTPEIFFPSQCLLTLEKKSQEDAETHAGACAVKKLENLKTNEKKKGTQRRRSLCC